MSTYTFRKTPDPDNSFDRSMVEHAIDAESLPDLMEEFENFLRGCGFTFDGHIEVVDDEDDEDDEDGQSFDDRPSKEYEPNDEDKESEELHENDFLGYLDKAEHLNTLKRDTSNGDTVIWNELHMPSMMSQTVFINSDSESMGSQTVDMSDVKHNHLYNIEPRTGGYSRKYDFTDEELKNIKSSVSEDVSIVYTGPNDKIPKGTLV